MNGTLTAAGGVYINGGTLSGSGAVNGSVVSSATVYPGDPTTLTINGNYTQNAGGMLVIDISSATDYTMLDVNGNANLDGTVDFNFLNGYVPLENTGFAFLHVSGSASGDFAGLDIAGINCPSCTLDLSTMSLDTGNTPPSPISTTPEPGSLLLFGTGLVGLAWTLRPKLQSPAA
ncbi:MAG: PEP-CTERM sorting domain-containing protein [Terriglobia bacterium]